MAYDYSDLLAQAQSWAEQVVAAGWLHKNSAQDLFSMDKCSSDSLFIADSHSMAFQPLTVAFMGGTGVGKSSLLNRLAGQPIARAGVQRPTSREVTLYHHQSLSLQQLPAGLPLDSLKINSHDDINNSHIVWMDMPDFDSIEQGNQHMVLEWLPHIDVLLYVVSPERYRDNKAWQLLLAEGLKHAWLFVMNQWDRGQTVQYEDFKQQLHKAGFHDPLVFRTSCTEPDGDEFPELLLQIQALSGRNSRLQLEQHNQQLRSQQLKQSLQVLLDAFKVRDYPQLQQQYESIWQKTETSLQQGLAWPLQQLSTTLTERSGQNPDIKIWDDWAQSRLDDALDELVLQAVQLDIPSKSLKAALHDIKSQAAKTVANITELAGRQALIKPGNGLQRFLLRLTAICETLLPLAAMAVVGYQVFSGYYYSTANIQAYLGVDFAVHSLLLIGLCWLIPFFLHKKLQPSLQKTALKGVQKGMQQALLAIDAEIKNLLSAERKRNTVLQQELADLLAKCEPGRATQVEKNSLLGRVLAG